MLHYQDVVNCLSHHLPIANIPELIIVYICNDMIDWFTIPHKFQQRIETKYCIKTINNNTKETRLWNNLHSCCDEPAVEWDDGSKEWYKNGLKHRDNDLPAVQLNNGNKIWYKKWRKTP